MIDPFRSTLMYGLPTSLSSEHDQFRNRLVNLIFSMPTRLRMLLHLSNCGTYRKRARVGNELSVTRWFIQRLSQLRLAHRQLDLRLLTTATDPILAMTKPSQDQETGAGPELEIDPPPSTALGQKPIISGETGRGTGDATPAFQYIKGIKNNI